MERKSEIFQFIQARQLMTISSINSAERPQAALVGFGETNAFQLIFGTSNSSRKYSNILKNPIVAVVMWDGPKTIQYEGIARELKGSEREKFSENYFKKNPKSLKYKELHDQTYFLIEPTWIRYTDISRKPWDIVELQF